jgi:hypothetical protein
MVEKSWSFNKIILELALKSPDFVKNRSIRGYKTPISVDLALPFQYDENRCFI